jgi:hypothetical protein
MGTWNKPGELRGGFITGDINERDSRPDRKEVLSWGLQDGLAKRIVVGYMW